MRIAQRFVEQLAEILNAEGRLHLTGGRQKFGAKMYGRSGIFLHIGTKQFDIVPGATDLNSGYLKVLELKELVNLIVGKKEYVS